MAQKWSILDQKWQNMAALSTCQSGPKGCKRDQNGQPKCFWPFGTLLDLSGPVCTISNKNWFFALKHLRQTLLCPFGAKNHLISDGISLYITPIHMYVPYPQHCATLSQGWLQAESQGLLKQANCQSPMPQKKTAAARTKFLAAQRFLVAEERIGGETDRWTRRLSTVGNHYFKAQTAISQSMAPCK